MLIVKCKHMYYADCRYSKCHYLSVVVPPGAYNKNLILTAASIDCGRFEQKLDLKSSFGCDKIHQDHLCVCWVTL